MRGTRGASVLVLLIAGSGLGQALAPPQPREARFVVRQERMGPGSPGTGLSSDSVSTGGNPLPAPLGLGVEGGGVMSARVFAPGMQVQIPESAAGTGARMLVLPNANGGQSAILYNPGTGAIVEYDQTLNVSRLGQGPRYGLPTTAIFQSGQGTQSGVGGGATNVTTNPLTGTFRGVDAGIPSINALTPSYNYRANAPGTFSTPPPVFGNPGSVGAGTSSPISVTSPPPPG